MTAILSLLLVLGASLIVTRVAAVALVHTGMSRDSARFQARSAFTGAGFTTSEAEHVVGHPVRRRIVSGLMIVGNLGFVTVLASLMISLIDLRSSESALRGGVVLVVGVVSLFLLSASSSVDRVLCSVVSWALRRFTSLDTRDYAGLLHLREDYGVTELLVRDGDWLVDTPIEEAGLDLEGVRLLGIECPGGHFLGAPGDDVQIRAGDRLVLYGRGARIAELDERAAGEESEEHHREAIRDQARIGREERDAAGR